MRHPEYSTYRCFLPDLTGFIALRRARPGPQHRFTRTVLKDRDLEKGFNPAIADFGYRAPLVPRLARPIKYYYGGLDFSRLAAEA